MAQTSPSRIDTPTRLSAVVCLLVLVWIVTYWLWQPRRAGGPDQLPVTFAEPAGPPAPAPTPTPTPDPALPDPQATGPQVPVADPLATTPRVDPPTFADYVIQEGDVSMEVISQRHYGTRRHAAAILQANPFVDPTKLVPGRTRLRIPTDPANVQGRPIASSGLDDPAAPPALDAPQADPPDSTAPRTVEYTITREDTLWEIAEAYYGKGHLWRKIYDANRDIIANPDRPPVGKTIRIPPID